MEKMKQAEQKHLGSIVPKTDKSDLNKSASKEAKCSISKIVIRIKLITFTGDFTERKDRG